VIHLALRIARWRSSRGGTGVPCPIHSRKSLDLFARISARLVGAEVGKLSQLPSEEGDFGCLS
jgi:hypothetical protein